MELLRGKKREKFKLESLGWKTAKDKLKNQFYALDSKGNPSVVTLKVALPGFYSPGYPVAYTNSEPFPEAVCIKISPCRLLPPPCYLSREEFESQRHCHSHFEPWKATYLDMHSEISILESKDDKPLQKRLDKWLTVLREAYERRVDAYRKEIARLPIEVMRR